MKVIILVFTFAILSLQETATINSAMAVIGETSPSAVCNYLVGIEYPTIGWKEYQPIYGCTSHMKELGTSLGSNRLKNNLAYYVEGDKKQVRILKLLLNVNNKAEVNKAHLELLEAADELSIKSLGERLPDAAAQAILDGKNFMVIFRGATINLTRDDWPTGKGYSLKITIE